jgi:hypothetical protein
MSCTPALRRLASTPRYALAPRMTLSRFSSTSSSAPSAGTPATAAAATASSTPISPRSVPRSAPRKQGKAVMIGLAVFIACGFSFPFWLHHHNASSGNHYTASKPLTSSQVMRGAYMNTGTRDIGPDPTWHAKHGITPVEGDAKKQ